MSTDNLKNLKDILTPINVVNYDDTEIGSHINDRFSSINSNFKKIFEEEYIRGAKGESVIVKDLRFCYDPGFSNEELRGETVIDEVMYEKPIKDEDYNVVYYEGDQRIELSVGSLGDLIYNTILNSFLPNSSQEESKKHVLINDGVEVYWYDNLLSINNLTAVLVEAQDDPSTLILKSILPYTFKDARFSDVSPFKNHNLYLDIQGSSKIYDTSCSICFNNDKFVVRQDFPTLYYDEDVNEFCWKVNGKETKLIAQGPKGDKGVRSLNLVKIGRVLENGDYDGKIVTHIYTEVYDSLMHSERKWIEVNDENKNIINRCLDEDQTVLAYRVKPSTTLDDKDSDNIEYQKICEWIVCVVHVDNGVWVVEDPENPSQIFSQYLVHDSMIYNDYRDEGRMGLIYIPYQYEESNTQATKADDGVSAHALWTNNPLNELGEEATDKISLNFGPISNINKLDKQTDDVVILGSSLDKINQGRLLTQGAPAYALNYLDKADMDLNMHYNINMCDKSLSFKTPSAETFKNSLFTDAGQHTFVPEVDLNSNQTKLTLKYDSPIEVDFKNPLLNIEYDITKTKNIHAKNLTLGAHVGDNIDLKTTNIITDNEGTIIKSNGNISIDASKIHTDSKYIDVFNQFSANFVTGGLNITSPKYDVNTDNLKVVGNITHVNGSPYYNNGKTIYPSLDIMSTLDDDGNVESSVIKLELGTSDISDHRLTINCEHQYNTADDVNIDSKYINITSSDRTSANSVNIDPTGTTFKSDVTINNKLKVTGSDYSKIDNLESDNAKISNMRVVNEAQFDKDAKVNFEGDITADRTISNKSIISNELIVSSDGVKSNEDSEKVAITTNSTVDELGKLYNNGGIISGKTFIIEAFDDEKSVTDDDTDTVSFNNTSFNPYPNKLLNELDVPTKNIKPTPNNRTYSNTIGKNIPEKIKKYIDKFNLDSMRDYAVELISGDQSTPHILNYFDTPDKMYQNFKDFAKKCGWKEDVKFGAINLEKSSDAHMKSLITWFMYLINEYKTKLDKDFNDKKITDIEYTTLLRDGLFIAGHYTQCHAESTIFGKTKKLQKIKYVSICDESIEDYDESTGKTLISNNHPGVEYYEYIDSDQSSNPEDPTSLKILDSDSVKNVMAYIGPMCKPHDGVFNDDIEGMDSGVLFGFPDDDKLRVHTYSKIPNWVNKLCSSMFNLFNSDIEWNSGKLKKKDIYSYRALIGQKLQWYTSNDGVNYKLFFKFAENFIKKFKSLSPGASNRIAESLNFAAVGGNETFYDVLNRGKYDDDDVPTSYKASTNIRCFMRTFHYIYALRSIVDLLAYSYKSTMTSPTKNNHEYYICYTPTKAPAGFMFKSHYTEDGVDKEKLLISGTVSDLNNYLIPYNPTAIVFDKTQLNMYLNAVSSTLLTSDDLGSKLNNYIEASDSDILEIRNYYKNPIISTINDDSEFHDDITGIKDNISINNFMRDDTDRIIPEYRFTKHSDIIDDNIKQSRKSTLQNPDGYVTVWECNNPESYINDLGSYEFNQNSDIANTYIAPILYTKYKVATGKDIKENDDEFDTNDGKSLTDKFVPNILSIEHKFKLVYTYTDGSQKIENIEYDSEPKKYELYTYDQQGKYYTANKGYDPNIHNMFHKKLNESIYEYKSVNHGIYDKDGLLTTYTPLNYLQKSKDPIYDTYSSFMAFPTKISIPQKLVNQSKDKTITDISILYKCEVEYGCLYKQLDQEVYKCDGDINYPEECTDLVRPTFIGVSKINKYVDETFKNTVYSHVLPHVFNVGDLDQIDRGEWVNNYKKDSSSYIGAKNIKQGNFAEWIFGNSHLYKDNHVAPRTRLFHNPESINKICINDSREKDAGKVVDNYMNNLIFLNVYNSNLTSNQNSSVKTTVNGIEIDYTSKNNIRLLPYNLTEKQLEDLLITYYCNNDEITNLASAGLVISRPKIGGTLAGEHVLQLVDCNSEYDNINDSISLKSGLFHAFNQEGSLIYTGGNGSLFKKNILCSDGIIINQGSDNFLGISAPLISNSDTETATFDIAGVQHEVNSKYMITFPGQAASGMDEDGNPTYKNTLISVDLAKLISTCLNIAGEQSNGIVNSMDVDKLPSEGQYKMIPIGPAEGWPNWIGNMTSLNYFAYSRLKGPKPTDTWKTFYNNYSKYSQNKDKSELNISIVNAIDNGSDKAYIYTEDPFKNTLEEYYIYIVENIANGGIITQRMVNLYDKIKFDEGSYSWKRIKKSDFNPIKPEIPTVPDPEIPTDPEISEDLEKPKDPDQIPIYIKNGDKWELGNDTNKALLFLPEENALWGDTVNDKNGEYYQGNAGHSFYVSEVLTQYDDAYSQPCIAMTNGETTFALVHKPINVFDDMQDFEENLVDPNTVIDLSKNYFCIGSKFSVNGVDYEVK